MICMKKSKRIPFTLRKNIKLELVARSQDEFEFEDEVDYPPSEKLSKRFSKYKSLKSFKNSDWDPYENLPEDFKKLFFFKEFPKVMKASIHKAKEEAFVYNGFFVKICLKNFDPTEMVKGNIPIVFHQYNFRLFPLFSITKGNIVN